MKGQGKAVKGSERSRKGTDLLAALIHRVAKLAIVGVGDLQTPTMFYESVGNQKHSMPRTGADSRPVFTDWFCEPQQLSILSQRAPASIIHCVPAKA